MIGMTAGVAVTRMNDRYVLPMRNGVRQPVRPQIRHSSETGRC